MVDVVSNAKHTGVQDSTQAKEKGYGKQLENYAMTLTLQEKL